MGKLQVGNEFKITEKNVGSMDIGGYKIVEGTDGIFIQGASRTYIVAGDTTLISVMSKAELKAITSPLLDVFKIRKNQLYVVVGYANKDFIFTNNIDAANLVNFITYADLESRGIEA